MMPRKPVQIFSDESLRHSSKLSTREIVDYLENFRTLMTGVKSKRPAKLISLKVEEELLGAFRQKAELQGLRYQSQIKKLMRKWLEE